MWPLDGDERQRRQGDDGETLAGRVEMTAVRAPGFRYDLHRHQQRQHRHRHDDDEDAAPAGRVDQQPADGGADGEREAVAARPDADSTPTLLGVAVGDGQDRQRRWQLERGAEASQRTSGDQDRGIRRQRADERADGDERDPAGEDQPAPIEVAEGAAGQEQRGIDEVVGVTTHCN